MERHEVYQNAKRHNTWLENGSIDTVRNKIGWDRDRILNIIFNNQKYNQSMLDNLPIF